MNSLIGKWAKQMRRHFTEEKIQMANKHMNRCLTSLAIKEMQIKTTMKYHYILIKMTNVKNNRIKCWWGCKNCIIYTLLVGMWNGTVIPEKIAFSLKVNLHLPYDTATVLLDIYSRNINQVHTKTSTCFYSNSQ